MPPTRRKKPETYEQLQRKWYKRLADSGFEDIEHKSGGLKRWSSRIFERHTIEQLQAKESYYRMAEKFLIEYPFEDNLTRVIWEYHTNGISARDIARLLKKAKVLDTSHHTIWRTIVRLEHSMKQRYLAGYANE